MFVSSPAYLCMLYVIFSPFSFLSFACLCLWAIVFAYESVGYVCVFVLTQDTDVTGLRPLQPEQQTIVATPVGACELPALV